MGNNFIDNRHRHKPKGSDKHNFHHFHFGLGLSGFRNILALADTKIQEMAETKFLIFLLNLIGFPLFGFTLIYIGADNFKAWTLWALAAVFGIYKLIHAHLQAVKMNQENKDRELDLKKKEYNLYRNKE